MMPEEIKDANIQEETSPLEGAVADSPTAEKEAQAQVSEAATPEQAVTQEPVKEEVPLHEQPRFKEVIAEKNWYKQQLEEQLQRQQAPQPPPTPTDPYAGMTPEEKVFWMKQREIAREEARKEFSQNVAPQIEAAKREFARLQISQFRDNHPDVKPDSPEEMQIAAKVRQGYSLDDAYKVVMWGRKVGEKQQQQTQQQQQRLQAKRQANVVSPRTVSSQATSSPKMSYEEEIRHKLEHEWDNTM